MPSRSKHSTASNTPYEDKGCRIVGGCRRRERHEGLHKVPGGGAHLGVVPAQHLGGDVVQAAHVLVEGLVFIGELYPETEVYELRTVRREGEPESKGKGKTY